MKYIIFLLLCSTANANDIYNKNCLTCHGEKLDGYGPVGQYLNPRPRNLIKDKFKQGDKVTDIYNTISNGIPETQMPSFSSILNDKERMELATFIFTLRNK